MNKGLFLCGLFIALFLAACGDDEVKIANQMTLYSRPDTIHLGGDLGMDSILAVSYTHLSCSIRCNCHWLCQRS